MKKIVAGEYEHKGYSISKDEFQSNLWWVSEIVPASESHFRIARPAQDFRTLRGAKLFIDSEETA